MIKTIVLAVAISTVINGILIKLTSNLVREEFIAALDRKSSSSISVINNELKKIRKVLEKNSRGKG